MKKIMFNDKFLLTQAVLGGTKTMTRRIVDVPTECVFKTIADSQGSIIHAVGYDEKPVFRWETRYQIGEVVAVAQRYSDIGAASFDEWERETNWFKKGFTNKMFVRADLMPHHIKITDVRVERLQDITNEDCLKEGVWQFCYDTDLFYVSKDIGYAGTVAFPSSREAFWYLINKICGKGTWERNPWVEAYTFTRVD